MKFTRRQLRKIIREESRTASLPSQTTKKRKRKKGEAIDQYLYGVDVPNSEDEQLKWHTWAGGENVSNPKIWKDVLELIDEGDTVKISRSQLERIISEEVSKILSEARYDWSAETGAVPREGVPWVFGPEGYAKRPELHAKMKALAVGPHTDMLTQLKVALSNRAEELIIGPDGEPAPYLHTVDPAHFSSLAQQIMKDYIMGQAGDRIPPEHRDKKEILDYILNKIDAGDPGVPDAPFDEDIDDVPGWRGSAGGFHDIAAAAEDVGAVESGFDILPPDESSFPLAPPEGSLTESRLMQLAALHREEDQ